MKRREFIALLGVAVTSRPIIAFAQARRPLIAVIIASSQAASERWRHGLPQGLEELGQIEGRDYEIEYRYADGDPVRQPAIVEELIRHKPKVIVAGTTLAALAAKQATASIPIVCPSLTDPVGVGLVASEAHPGGNVTGILARVEGLPGKSLQLALDVLPTATKIGLLVNVNNPADTFQRRETEAAATKLGVNLVQVEVRTADEVGAAIQAFTRENVDIAVVLGDAMFINVRRQIAAFALASRLPTVYGRREHVEDGGLISYGIDLRGTWRRTAYYVDRILKGEKPADLPIEFPTKLELVINLSTAKALGMTIPEAFLLRADEVIE
jgi:putative ABC transport system substrate-binding protein